jgi:alpha-aminoadipate/glutamate carrier protein LysW
MKKCPECDAIIIIPTDCEEGEVIVCPECGLELEHKKGELFPVAIEGEDWGE